MFVQSRRRDQEQHRASSARRPVCVALVAVALIMTAAPASAATPQERAYSLFQSAREQVDAGHFDEAVVLLEEAIGYFRHPGIMLLKAHALRRLYRLDQAQEIVDEVAAGTVPRALRKTLAEEGEKLAEAKALRGRLRVTVEPETAVVAVLGEQVKGGYDRWVPIGKHRVEILATGYKPGVETAVVEAGAEARLTVRLMRQGGTIAVDVPGGLRGVTIRIDDEALPIPDGGEAGDRTSRVRLEIGPHRVRCTAGTKQVEHSVTLEADAALVVVCADMHDAVGLTAVGWSGVAAGLAVAGYGAWGLGSYIVELQDVGVTVGEVKSTNKHYGGALYLVSGLAAGFASYWFLLRDAAATPAKGRPATAGATSPGTTTPMAHADDQAATPDRGT